MKKRIFCFLLCLLLVVGLMPSGHVHAEWDEGVDCEFCGEHIWGDWVCEHGDHCGENSDYYDCFEMFHCTECGNCFEGQIPEYYCIECGRSNCCVIEEDFCTSCGMCNDCAGEMCMHCGVCSECRGSDFICEECGRCDECGGGHCTSEEDNYCSRCHAGYVCADCGKCLLDGDVDVHKDFCKECYRCADCVEKCSAWGGACENLCLDCHDDYEYCPDCHHCWAADILSMDYSMPMGCMECGRCSNCVSAICKNCNKCYECVGICERCGDFCLDCHQEMGDACPECGMCSYDVDSCPGCGVCNECNILCDDCGACLTCAAEATEKTHCPDCGACTVSGGAVLCEGCGLCQSCANVCEDCGMCTGCEPDDHCSMCYGHVDYDDLCLGCGACSDCVELCEGCGYCEDCRDVANHCSECGVCVENVELCESCGMCDECAKEENQHCGESDCNNCYEDYLYCAVCDKCIECIGEDDYCFTCYQCKAHHVDGKCDGKSSHTHKVGDWQSNQASHWQECRLCKEELYTASHKFNADNKCTVCGYEANTKIIITRQPQNARAKVSDCDADEDEPLFEKNNTVTFTVTATSGIRGAKLSYQWYYSYKSYLETHPDDKYKYPLTDIDEDHYYKFIQGSDTSRLTTYVSTTSCTDELVYFCKITLTSSDGKVLATVDSDIAELRVSHVYTRCYRVNEDFAGYLYTEDGRQLTMVKDDGHLYYCCGEEDGDRVDPSNKTPQAHVYGAPELIKARYSGGELKDWYKYTCKECHAVRYVQKHEHKFELKEDEALMDAYCTDQTHPLRCQVDGCTAIRHDQHTFEARVFHGPTENESIDFGDYMLVCTQCEYSLRGKDLYKANGENSWGGMRTLITAENAGVQVLDYKDEFDTLCLAMPGDTVLLIPVVNTYSKRVTGWKGTYTDYSQKDSDGNYKVVEISFSSYKNTEDGSWWFVAPSQDYYESWGVNSGGWLHITPKYADCKHANGTKLANYVAAACMRDGYTGDEVCVDCGKLIGKTGDFVAAPSTGHTGEWVLVEGTAVEGDCWTKGYEGDYRCSDCGEIKEGADLGYKHSDETELWHKVEATCVNPGYTGDVCCKECGKILEFGKTLPLDKSNHKHITATRTFSRATCTKPGQSAKIVCKDCGVTVQEAGVIRPLGHQWDDGTITKEPTETETGTKIYKCKRVGCNRVKTVTLPALGTASVESVAVTVTAPVTGAIAAVATTAQTTYTITATAWADKNTGAEVAIGGAFEGGKIYTVRVELQTADNSFFTTDTVFTINGVTATVKSLDTESATLTFTFPATQEADIPTNPTKPADPTDPVKPTEPATPTEPTKPADPAKPTEPVTPTDPTESTAPVTTGTPEGDTDTPKTGDNGMMGLWSILLSLSGLAVLVIAVYSKKKKVF